MGGSAEMASLGGLILGLGSEETSAKLDLDISVACWSGEAGSVDEDPVSNILLPSFVTFSKAKRSESLVAILRREPADVSFFAFFR